MRLKCYERKYYANTHIHTIIPTTVCSCFHFHINHSSSVFVYWTKTFNFVVALKWHNIHYWHEAKNKERKTLNKRMFTSRSNGRKVFSNHALFCVVVRLHTYETDTDLNIEPIIHTHPINVFVVYRHYNRFINTSFGVCFSFMISINIPFHPSWPNKSKQNS